MSDLPVKSRRDQVSQSRQLLGSQRSIDIKLGLDMLFNLLKSDLEDPEIYSYIVEAGREHSSYQGYVRERLEVLSAQGSKSAQRALDELQKPPSDKVGTTDPSLSSTPAQDQLSQADDLYYAAQYDQAINLYKDVLKSDPQNSRAKDQLKKAELLKDQERLNQRLPREAVQFYRRARSFLNAKDIRGAANLLNAALDAVQKSGVTFPEAQELLAGLDDALAAVEFREKADAALRSNNLDEAQRQLEYVRKLDSSDAAVQNLLNQIQTLQKVEDNISLMENAPGNLGSRARDLIKIRQDLESSQIVSTLKDKRDSLAQRWQSISNSVAKDLLVQSEKAIALAQNNRSSLEVKAQQFEKAAKLHEEALEIDPNISLPDGVDPVTQAHLAKSAIARIAQLKESHSFPEGALSADLELWSKIAPQDPDVKSIATYLANAKVQKQLQLEKEAEDTKDKQRHILLTVVQRILIGGVVLIIVILLGLFSYKSAAPLFVPKPTSTPTSTFTPTVTPEPTFTLTQTPSDTLTPSVTPTRTLTPKPSATPSVLGITYRQTGTYDSPNGNQIGFIIVNQPVVVLEIRQVGQVTWYFCAWEVNGTSNTGWIRNYVQIISSP